MSPLIIGYGEIGKAVQEAVCPDAKIYDIKRKNSRVGPVDIMHVCFSYDKDFVHNVQSYAIQWQPKHIIIWSTVQIGTTKKIRDAVHSPVEGKHPNLAESIENAVRWVGYNNKYDARFFSEYFTLKGFKTKLVKNTNHTEALKLLSTTEYGINIAFADYKAQVAESIKMSYELTKDWNSDYNELYDDDPRFQKFILDPPAGQIGGHCVVPNVDILEPKYPHKILEIIKEVGK